MQEVFGVQNAVCTQLFPEANGGCGVNSSKDTPSARRCSHPVPELVKMLAMSEVSRKNLSHPIPLMPVHTQ
jgi:hypothetical protein